MAAAAGAAAAIAKAIKASGVIVRVDPVEFQNILNKIDHPLVVCAKGGIFTAKHQYLVSYKGLAFFTKATAQIVLPSSAETIVAKKIGCHEKKVVGETGRSSLSIIANERRAPVNMVVMPA